MTKAGKLTIFPSPIEETGVLSTEDRNFLELCFKNQQCQILVEDHKPARRRWVAWGLPREAIDEMIPYNEHNMRESLSSHIETLKKGQDIVLMSDGGMPGFCDPGAELIFRCHRENIGVECRPFYNSVLLSLALSGLPHDQFFFSGFPPAKKEERSNYFKSLNAHSHSIILMDTPYRLKNILIEIAEYLPSRMAFLALELGSHEQELILDNAADLKNHFGQEKVKKEFVLILGPKGFQGY